MPIVGPASYTVVVPLFLNHWEDANEAGAEVVLDRQQAGQVAPVQRGRLVELFDLLVEARDEVEGALLEQALAAADVLSLKTQLQEACTAFNRIVRADHGASRFAQVLPVAPNVTDGREKFLKPMRLMLMLWQKVNDFRNTGNPVQGPIMLAGGVTRGNIETRLEELRTAFNAVEERGQQADLERGRRDDLQGEIYPILKVYRLKIVALFAADTAMVRALPALTPVPGASPEAPGLSGEWSTEQTKAVLTGTPSSSASVVRHQYRASVGEDPSAEDETVIAEFTAGTPLELATDYGLTAPGERAHYRLVAITADGHEKGSEWVTIMRPLA